jgi:hypothetical protein
MATFLFLGTIVPLLVSSFASVAIGIALSVLQGVISKPLVRRPQIKRLG